MVGGYSSFQGNQIASGRVQPSMDETAAWHIALWEIEMQKYFAEEE